MKCLLCLFVSLVFCQSVLVAQVRVFESNTIAVHYHVGDYHIRGFDSLKGQDQGWNEEFADGYSFSELCPTFNVGVSYHFLDIESISFGMLFSYSSAENTYVDPVAYPYIDNNGVVSYIGTRSDREFVEMTLALSALYSVYASEARNWELIANFQCGYTEIELSRILGFTNKDVQFNTPPRYPDQIKERVFSGVHCGAIVSPTYNFSDVVFVGAELGATISLYGGSNDMVDTTMLYSFRYGLKAGVNL